MKLKEALQQLEALGNERMRAQNAKRGAGDHQFGLRLGDIRNLAPIWIREMVCRQSESSHD
jgi:hypothetical protein